MEGERTSKTVTESPLPKESKPMETLSQYTHTLLSEVFLRSNKSDHVEFHEEIF